MTKTPAGLSYAELADDRLLDLLATEFDRLPRAAVDEFVARGERMIEPLTRILQDEAEWVDGNPAFWRPVHATFILGAIGGEKAIPGLLAALKGSNVADVDWLTDALPSIFAAIGPAAIGPLRDRCREPELDPYERWGLFSSLALIAAGHPEARTELLDFLRAVTDDAGLPDEDRSFAAFELLDFARPEDRDALREAARRNGSGRQALFNRDDVDNAYGPNHRTLSAARDWLLFYDAKEIDARQERWRKEDSQEGVVEPDASEFMEDADSAEDVDDAPPPLRADPAAAGRNDPCPCGSGKKFKKCCG